MKRTIACAWIALALACKGEPGAGERAASSNEADASSTSSTGAAKPTDDASETGETGDPLSGEAAHVIPFADRTSMGYLLLLPPSDEPPEAPTREQLQTWVRAAFPDRASRGELDLLLTLIATEPHSTDAGASFGDLQVPSIPDSAELEGEGTKQPAREPGEVEEIDEAAVNQMLDKRERQRVFDLIGLHVELLRQGIGEDTLIPASALTDPVLTRALDRAERESLPGRGYALLLRADYRNQHGVRGLRLLQTLVRVVAERTGALIHDPDTLETLDLEAFERRRLRINAGNVADQLAIVPFEDPRHLGRLRLSTRGMRRFGAVDLELDALPADPIVLQQATDLLAGLALALVREGEVDPSGFAVEVPDEIEVTGDLMRQSYGDREVSTCAACPGSVVVHLVERPTEDHDPRGHVVARVVAPRSQSDAADYDHPQWVGYALSRLFGTAGPASLPTEPGAP